MCVKATDTAGLERGVHTVACKLIGDRSIVLPQSSAKLNFAKEQLGINWGVNNDPNMCLLAKQHYKLD